MDMFSCRNLYWRWGSTSIHLVNVMLFSGQAPDFVGGPDKALARVTDWGR